MVMLYHLQLTFGTATATSSTFNITTTSISISIMIRYGDALPCPVPQSSVARGTKVSGNKDAISY